MNQTKTTQTKKKSVSKPSNKPSVSKKTATPRRSSPKLPQAMPPLVVASDAEVESTNIESADTDDNAQMMSAPADLTDATVGESDDNKDPLYQGTGTDEQRELPVGISLENEVAELVSTAQITRTSESPDPDEMTIHNEDIDSDAPLLAAEHASTREIADAADGTEEPFKGILDVSESAEQIEPSESDDATLDAAISDVAESDAVAQDDGAMEMAALPATLAKGVKRHLKSISSRYANACDEVSRLRKEFISLLDSKSAHIGVPRVGEAVPLRNTEVEALNAEIREARRKLDELMARKRQLKGANPDLDTINTRIREINRQRQAARLEKKAAYEEAIEAQSLVERAPHTAL